MAPSNGAGFRAGAAASESERLELVADAIATL